MKIKYVLTSPTFELSSTDIDVILKMFEDCVCDQCKAENGMLSDEWRSLGPKEKVVDLLTTMCGDEFIFEVLEVL